IANVGTAARLARRTAFPGHTAVDIGAAVHPGTAVGDHPAIRVASTVDARARMDGGANVDGGMPGECGASGQACCSSDVCDEDLACIGGRCSCIRRLAINEHGTCALRVEGSLFCVGANENGQLATGAFQRDELQPVRTQLAFPIEQAFRGAFHTCAIVSENDAFCWGNNQDAQLGVPEVQVNTATPERLAPLPEVGWASMSLGSFHSCALDTSDRVWCWGQNQFGQSGRPEIGAPVVLPALVDLRPSNEQVTEVAAGAFHTCALVDGTVYCWGRNESLQVGSMGFGSVSIPQLVLDQAIRVVAGDFHSCALRSDRSIWCWGFNSNGELGRGTISSSELPGIVSGDRRYKDLAAMDNHTCAISEDDDVFCWGRNVDGQLGIGVSGPPFVTPQPVDIEAPVQVVGGRSHTCVLRAGGEVLCFGGSGFGELGRGIRSRTATPTRSLLSCDNEGGE
ncbi:MAG: hypothetical protein AAFV29_10850, partial [Myxococcota bacterium]